MKDYFMVKCTYSTTRGTESTTTVVEADSENEARMLVALDLKPKYGSIQIVDIQRTSKLMYQIGLYMDHKIEAVDPSLFPTQQQGEVA